MSLQVRLLDVNGPRGGENKQVRVIVGLGVCDDVVVEETGADAYAFISLAADRVKQSVGRKLAKAEGK